MSTCVACECVPVSAYEHAWPEQSMAGRALDAAGRSKTHTSHPLHFTAVAAAHARGAPAPLPSQAPSTASPLSQAPSTAPPPSAEGEGTPCP